MVKFPKAIKHRLEYVGFRLAEVLVRALPLETASALSGALWRRLGPYSRRHRRALTQLARALPETSTERREAIAREMWDTLGRTFAETFRLADIVDGDKFILEREDYWRARAATEGGWVVCSAHFGNWEIAAGALRKIGRSTAGVYQKLSNPLVETRVRVMRDFLYPSGLFPKDARTGVRVLHSVRRGAALAILADLRDRSGLAVEFFGTPAPTHIFPALLARNLGAPLLVGRVRRLPGVRFALNIVEIAVPKTEDSEADVRVATEAVQRQLEEWIRADPGQWMWSHRRWG